MAKAKKKVPADNAEMQPQITQKSVNEKSAKSAVIRCGTAAIVGRPNVGKSTLLNRILEEKVSIVSDVPQTTRFQIRGIYNDERGQIIFIDTPGMHLGKDKLNAFMCQASAGTFDAVDCIIYLTDASRHVGKEEKFVAEKLKDTKIPVILGFNKVDLKDVDIASYIAHWEEVKGMPVAEMKDFTLIALSAKDGSNIDKLIEIIFGYLPEGPALYPEDMISDTPQKILIADIIREKLFHIMREELPHAIGVVIDQLEHRKNKVLYIHGTILVERESQKEIVIGKKGQVLKTIGTQARVEIQELTESNKVFLELYVKAEERWRDDITILRELGYDYTL